MTRKRKRAQATAIEPALGSKRLKCTHVREPSNGAPALVQHPTLRLYYNNVSTLRHYLLSRLLPSTSKARVRRLVLAGTIRAHNDVEPESDSKRPLAAVLDQTLGCSRDEHPQQHFEIAKKDFEAFSQQATLTPGSSFEEGTTPQSEVS